MRLGSKVWPNRQFVLSFSQASTLGLPVWPAALIRNSSVSILGALNKVFIFVKSRSLRLNFLKGIPFDVSIFLIGLSEVARTSKKINHMSLVIFVRLFFKCILSSRYMLSHK